MAALQHTIQLGMGRVELQTDASNLGDAERGEIFDRSDIGVLVKEAGSLCTLEFIDVKILACPRQCNKVADSLASFCLKLSGSDPLIWTDQSPEFVSVLVAGDLPEPTG